MTQGPMVVYKVFRMAEENWRRLNRVELFPLLWACFPFTDGEQVQNEDHRHVDRVTT